MSKLKAPRRVKRVTVSFDGPGRTKQSFKDETSIQKVVDRYRRTGDPFVLNPSGRPVRYSDLPDVSSFHEALIRVEQAEIAFASLSSKIRDHYDNDPELFLAALRDPKEAAFLTAEGIFEKPSGEAAPKSPEGTAAPSVEPPNTSAAEGKASG